MQQAEIHNITVNTKMTAEWVAAVDNWRADQRPILTRSEAIRVLVVKALKAESEEMVASK